METRQVNLRIPQELLDYVQKKDYSLNQSLTDALSRYRTIKQQSFIESIIEP